MSAHDEDESDDKDLFAKQMQHVKPLKTTPRVKPKPPAPKATIQAAEHEISYTLYDGQCDYLPEFVRDGVQAKQFQRLRKGALPIDIELDLHGYTLEQAREVFTEFMAECYHQQLRHLRIIHGKGLRSDGEPVLKNMVNNWLQQIPHVLAFCPAPRHDGGDGVTYVLLSRTSIAP